LRRAHEPAHCGFVGHVDAHGQRDRAQGLELGNGPLRLFRISRGDDDAGAGRRESPRHPEADPSVAARDDRYARLQVEHRSPPTHVRITSVSAFL